MPKHLHFGAQCCGRTHLILFRQTIKLMLVLQKVKIATCSLPLCTVTRDYLHFRKLPNLIISQGNYFDDFCRSMQSYLTDCAYYELKLVTYYRLTTAVLSFPPAPSTLSGDMIRTVYGTRHTLSGEHDTHCIRDMIHIV